MTVSIESSRHSKLASEFTKPYFHQLTTTLKEKKQSGELFYPSWSLIFNAFDTTPFEAVKVVILGQDPYHGPWQAHWLSFSVPDWVKQPPSLKNIFKEIHSDCWWVIPTSGNLTNRAEQWVFLLNAVLTVTARMPASHKWLWREQFTDAVIATISEHKDHVVFLLWWNFAKSKKALIDEKKHLVLQAPHPSPFSAHSWFFWSKHFSQCNARLVDHGLEPIVRL